MSLYLSFSQLYITCLLRVKPVGAEPMSRACSFIDNRFVASHVLWKTTNLLKLVKGFFQCQQTDNGLHSCNRLLSSHEMWLTSVSVPPLPTRWQSADDEDRLCDGCVSMGGPAQSVPSNQQSSSTFQSSAARHHGSSEVSSQRGQLKPRSGASSGSNLVESSKGMGCNRVYTTACTRPCLAAIAFIMLKYT